MATPIDDLKNDAVTGSSTGTGSGLFSVLWRRKALVLFGVAVGLVAGMLFYLQKVPIFQSTARMVVMKRRHDPMPMSGFAGGGGVQVVDDYVSTQEALLRSHVIWKRAADKLKGESLHMPPPGNDYISFIDNGLKVGRDKDASSGASNNVLTISFRGPSPEDCMLVVNAVIEGYRDSLSNAVSSVTDENFAQLLRSRDKAETNLNEAKEEYRTIHEKISSMSPMNISDLKSRIGVTEAKRGDLVQESIALESQRQLIHSGINRGDSRSALNTLFQLSNKGLMPDSGRTPDDALFQLNLQEQELLERLGPEHPEVVAIRRRGKLLGDFVNKYNRRPVDAEPQVPADPLVLYDQVLNQRVTENELKKKALQDMLDADRLAVQGLDKYVVQESEIVDKRVRLRKLLDQFDDRKFQLESIRDQPLFDANVITPSSVGGKVSPVLVTTLALAGFLGLVLGSGLAYMAELADKSFRSIEEVRQRLGVTVIGQVPPLTAHEPSVIEQHPLDPMLVVHHAPKSIHAEAYRGVRTSLYFSTRGKGHQVIQVTSPNPGDGKSTLIANLAASIAQSGKKVILIDADFRKPRVHKIFGLGTAEVGLASVIAGEAELESAIYTCEVPGLSILPCGPRPTNPADLLTSALFSEILDEIKKDYDFVLIDTPPLLAVSDPSVVAPRVDGVILTIRLVKNSRPMAEQAKERLSIVGAHILGVVVNGMDDGYGRYGYGYSYGYNYAYAYGDESDSSTNLLAKSR